MYASMLQHGKGKNRAKTEEEESKNRIRTSRVRRTPFSFCNFLDYSVGWLFSLWNLLNWDQLCLLLPPIGFLDLMVNELNSEFSYFVFVLWVLTLDLYVGFVLQIVFLQTLSPPAVFMSSEFRAITFYWNSNQIETLRNIWIQSCLNKFNKGPSHLKSGLDNNSFCCTIELSEQQGDWCKLFSRKNCCFYCFNPTWDCIVGREVTRLFFKRISCFPVCGSLVYLVHTTKGGVSFFKTDFQGNWLLVTFPFFEFLLSTVWCV